MVDSDDDAPIEQSNNFTTEPIETTTIETSSTLPPKKRKRTRKSRNVTQNGVPMGPPATSRAQPTLLPPAVLTPPPSTNSNRTETSSSPSISGSIEENNNEKPNNISDYDRKIAELLKKAEASVSMAEGSLGATKQRKQVVRKKVARGVKRARHIQIVGEEKVNYQDIIRSSRQYQSALELRRSMTGQSDRVSDPLARFKQNQRNYLSK